MTLCTVCGLVPPRRRRWATVCTACRRKAGLPMRQCRACKQRFPADVMSGMRCHPCASKARHAVLVATKYGLSADDYAALLEAQGGRCFICQRRPGGKRLAVDHDHACCPGPVSCGECVRGLLCRGCNRGVLGHLRDDVGLAQNVIDYLTDPPARRLRRSE